jgi:ribosomal protein S18 acetylase RimI-like enzyme
MQDIQYYVATVADVQTVLDLRIAFGIELSGPQTDERISAQREALTSYFNQHIADKTCVCLLAKAAGVAVGAGALIVRHQPGNFKNPSGIWGYIMNMYVAPDFRRMGIAATILNKLMDSGREMGITAFELHATKTGEPVYQKSGFEKHTEPTYRKYIVTSPETA